VLSQTVEYALRAVVALAADPERPQTSEQLAKQTRVPKSYLAKVLKPLVKAGLVGSQRGLHGGFTLARQPEKTTILDVVNAVEPIRRIHSCPLGLEAHSDQLCPLHGCLDETLALIEQRLGGTTLADVVHQPGQNRPLCDENGQDIGAADVDVTSPHPPTKGEQS